MIVKISNLAVVRQYRVDYGRQFIVEPVQHLGMRKEFAKAGTSVAHQGLNALVGAIRFS